VSAPFVSADGSTSLLLPDAVAVLAPARPGARPRRQVFPGSPAEVASARRFARCALDRCPVTGEAVQCLSEIAANAVQHTRSSGGTFEVILWRGPSSVLVAVADAGSDTIPVPAPPDAGSESGRGLALVALLATSWGHHGSQDGRVVWCVLDWATAGCPDAAGVPSAS